MLWFSPTNILWIFGHLVMVLIGILFVHGNNFVPQLSKEMAEAIGGSLIAAGIAGEALFLYVRASDTMRARLELFVKAGLLNVFPHRSVRIREEYDVRLREGKEIDVIGFGLSSFREDYADKFREFATHARVRILLLDPDFPNEQSSLADIRDNEEHNPRGQIRSDVEAFERTIREIPGLSHSRFQVKRLRAIPAVNLFRIDDVIFWGPYLIGQQSRNMPTLLVQRGGFLFDQLRHHFEALWTSEFSVIARIQ